jgi:hypothetical protein
MVLAVRGQWSVGGSLVDRVNFHSTPLPHARFLPAAQSCGAKESADGVIA